MPSILSRLSQVQWHATPPWTYQSQQTALLRLLALCVQRQLPLVPMLEAFVQDAHGRHKMRIVKFTSLLRSGVGLADAVEQVPRLLPAEAVLAVRFGQQEGTLAACLQNVARNRADRQKQQTGLSLAGFLFYIGLELAVLAMMLAFVMVKIIPTFEQILSDFGMFLPRLTRDLIEMSRYAVNYWFVLVLGVGLLLWFLTSDTVRRSARYGLLARLLRPLVGLSSAEILRNLAVVTEVERPITGALSTLGRYHPDATQRSRLLYVRNEVEQGVDVWEGMSQAGLVRASDAALLQSAARAGNLTWALHQTARRVARRVQHRTAVLREVLLPLVLIAVGACIGFVVVALFVPLVSLVSNLSAY